MFSLFKIDDDDVQKTRATINFYCVVLIVYASIGGAIDLEKLQLLGGTGSLEKWKVCFFFTIILAYLSFKLGMFSRSQPAIQKRKLLRENKELTAAGKDLTAILQDVRGGISQVAESVLKIDLTGYANEIDQHNIRSEEARLVINNYAKGLVAESRDTQKEEKPEHQQASHGQPFAVRADSLLDNLERLCKEVAEIKDNRRVLVSGIESQLNLVQLGLRGCQNNANLQVLDAITTAYDGTELDLNTFLRREMRDEILFDYIVPFVLTGATLFFVWCPQIIQALS